MNAEYAKKKRVIYFISTCLPVYRMFFEWLPATQKYSGYPNTNSPYFAANSSL